MALIKIINGTYGHRPLLPNGKLSPYIVSVTRADKPIEVPDEEAQRLIRKGIAAPVHGTAVATPVEPPAQSNPNGNTPDNGGGENSQDDGVNGEPPDDGDGASYTADMKAEDLRAAMRERGMQIKPGMSKQEMADALNSAEEFPDQAPEDVVE